MGRGEVKFKHGMHAVARALCVQHEAIADWALAWPGGPKGRQGVGDMQPQIAYRGNGHLHMLHEVLNGGKGSAISSRAA